MASNILNPIYPQPAYNGNTLLTSLSTTVTSGSTTASTWTLTTPVPSVIQLVTFDVQGDDCRVLWEGSTPTSTSGHILPGGTAYTWAYNQWANSKFILSSGSTACTIMASPFNGG